ncbi:PAS domain-containing protein [Polyangium sp. y55x31]|uniref:PAS domain-containing protein n=1 Tax=Polyangium sp. y55x31 TaxID=3042688 RepID=UPI0024830D4C|nr:PAS domain-containing protein [Polyangium sp. y55x31]MDI1483136.1 PAS domain-containing protein [Polyangium sp. y55x31]
MAFLLPNIERDDWKTFLLLQLVLDTIPDPIFVKDRAHRVIACNQGFCRLIGQPYEVLIGASDPDFMPKEQAEVFWHFDDVVFRSGQSNENEELATSSDGITRTIWTRKFPLRNISGDVVGLCGVVTDITTMKERLQRAERLEAENREQRAVIEAQTAMLDQMSMPVLHVGQGVLLLPLIGEISDRRAERALQTLLGVIHERGAEIVIFDVTGVPRFDTAVAGHLVRAVQATELLGCQSVLVGIGPEIARTLVELQVDFGRVAIRATLQDGITFAMKARDRRLRLPTGRA